jgi:alanyl-tRNA synthetase
MKSIEIRKKFFEFFVKNGHEHVTSSSLIPAEDPTLLFTNAGMNQFKDLFLGKEKRSYKRAVTIQKCVRAGGKHNDLENVGFTRRHLTFFEMMGNFSFGDYFKKEAITYAWDFLTQEVNLPKDKLYATVFRDDDEAYEIWNKQIGIPQERIFRLGEKDNFWQMGDIGPCGPCTEILIDRGPEYCKKGCTRCTPETCDERFLEIWNNVFMQFNRQPDGKLEPLTQKGVDTGMGLERLTAVLQNKVSVYETDLFMPMINRIGELTGLNYEKQPETIKPAFRVLADHIRSSCFLIAEGCDPSNDGRGYVLRKIIRRAALFEQKLTSKSIFVELVPTLIEMMKPVYPELEVSRQRIIKVLSNEICKFSQNLTRGLGVLEEFFATNQQPSISGQQAFKLYDTFGFPLELIKVAAQERDWTVDLDGFEIEMEKQRLQSGKKIQQESITDVKTITKTLFTGHTTTEERCSITEIIKGSESVQSVEEGSECWIICDKSPLYVECGGQVSDEGWFIIDDEQVAIHDIKKIGHAIAAKITAPVFIEVGKTIIATVNQDFRNNIRRNHTATHLLQAALIKLFGKEIKQAGSLVTADHLRFDFTWHENLTPDQIKSVEGLVNEQIWKNIPVESTVTTLNEATKKGVIAFFGEKYNPECVRMVAVPEFSAELCGGIHAQATGEIGCFKIIETSSLSAGTRRILGLTGPKALELFQQDFGIVRELCHEFKIQSHEIIGTVAKQHNHIRSLQMDIRQLKKQLYNLCIIQWKHDVKPINGIPFLLIKLQFAANEEMADIANQLQSQQPGLYFIVSNNDDRSSFVATVSPEFATKVSLKTLSNWLKDTHNLRGGGSQSMIQGGGPLVDEGLKQSVISWIIGLL